MTINENWAISAVRADAFLQEQKDVTMCEDYYKFKDCIIKLTPTVGYLGDMKIQRTMVYMEGPDEQINEIYKRFFLRFVSAGG